MQLRVETVVLDCLLKAQKYFPHSFEIPVINYNLRGRSAGQAVTNSNGTSILRLNPILLAENFEDSLANTVPHEMAHIIADSRYGLSIKPHGSEWKHIMIHVLGANPTRTHHYDVSNVALRTRKVEKFVYSCGCKTHTLSAIKHNRMLRNPDTYICRICKGKLFFQHFLP